MCTLITVSAEFFANNRAQVLDRIRQDARFNGDGWSLLCIDIQDTSKNVALQSMNLRMILRILDLFTDTCSPDSRIFLHARAATTRYTGIAYCHGFTDLRGRIFMHNGIVNNPEQLAIDSYSLIDLPLADTSMLEALKQRGDNYANVFVIDTDTDTYSVIRLATGSLHTDGNGNYSTHPIATIIKPVEQWSVATHDLFDYSYGVDGYSGLDEDDGYLYQSKYQSLLDKADAIYSSGWDSVSMSSKLKAK